MPRHRLLLLSGWPRLLGSLLLAWSLLCAAAGTSAAVPLPVRVERAGFAVRAEAGLERVAAAVAARIPAVRDAIAADLSGLPVPGHVEIRLVRDTRDLPAVAPAGRGAPDWAEGVAYPDLGIVAVALRRGAQDTALHSVVAHELAHIALHVALGGREPRWLTEGFANLHSFEWSMGRAQTLAGLAWSGDVRPLAELDRHFSREHFVIDRAYAQSYDLVAFLARRGAHADSADDGNRWPFREFLAGIARGNTVDESARKAFRAPLSRLVQEWYEDLRSRYLYLPAGLLALGVWVLGGLLLVAAYLRKRARARRILALWEEEERPQPPPPAIPLA
jgi:hypothetical protein